MRAKRAEVDAEIEADSNDLKLAVLKMSRTATRAIEGLRKAQTRVEELEASYKNACAVADALRKQRDELEHELGSTRISFQESQRYCNHVTARVEDLELERDQALRIAAETRGKEQATYQRWADLKDTLEHPDLEVAAKAITEHDRSLSGDYAFELAGVAIRRFLSSLEY